MRNDNHNDSNNTQWEQELIARIDQIEENSRDIVLPPGVIPRGLIWLPWWDLSSC